MSTNVHVSVLRRLKQDMPACEILHRMSQNGPLCVSEQTPHSVMLFNI